MSDLIRRSALIEDIQKNCFYFLGNTYKENDKGVSALITFTDKGVSFIQAVTIS